MEAIADAGAEAGPGSLIRDTRIAQAAEGQRSRLLAFIRRRVASDSQAEDILQDVFYQLLTSYSVTEPIETMTGWLFTVARNKIIDWYRRRRPGDRALDEALDGGPVTLAEVLPAPVEGPDTGYDREVIAEELAEALEELPEKQRQVFIMHEIEGKKLQRDPRDHRGPAQHAPLPQALRRPVPPPAARGTLSRGDRLSGPDFSRK
jgi:RNA polymerase sigma factor (sigma-70 family)